MLSINTWKLRITSKKSRTDAFALNVSGILVSINIFPNSKSNISALAGGTGTVTKLFMDDWLHDWPALSLLWNCFHSSACLLIKWRCRFENAELLKHQYTPSYQRLKPYSSVQSASASLFARYSGFSAMPCQSAARRAQLTFSSQRLVPRAATWHWPIWSH